MIIEMVEFKLPDIASGKIKLETMLRTSVSEWVLS